MTATIVPDDDAGRELAIEALRAGRLVAMPTDTVYGIGVALGAPGGIERLFAAKGRSPEKGVVLLLADHHQAADVAVLSPSFHVLAAAFWPGALTLVASRRADVGLPSALTGGAPTVGLRLPAHDAPRALAAVLGPLPVTSANRSGEPEAADAGSVVAALGEADDLTIVLDGGPTRLGAPSSVVDCSVDPPRLLRAGALTADVLSAVLVESGLPPVATV